MRSVKGNFLSELVDLAISKIPEDMDYYDDDDDFNYDEFDVDAEDYSTYPKYTDSKINLGKNYDEGLK